MKKLDGLAWKPLWTTLMGSIKGCLNYLGVNISDGWLFGTTGHAFVINIHEVLCPSGPTAWNSEMVFSQAPHIGFKITGDFGYKTQEDFEEIQRKAFENLKKAVDEGIPSYGWELEIPEYYVVNGYEEDAYHYSGCKFKPYEPLKWNKLGMTEISILQMNQVRLHEASDDKTTVKTALNNVFAFNDNSKGWVFEKYYSGPKAYDVWIEALKTKRLYNYEDQKEVTHGNTYNAHVWAECRMYAVEFLLEARKRLPEFAEFFTKAFQQFRISAEELQEFAYIFPFRNQNPEDFVDDKKVNTAVECLQRCRDAEIKGFEVLKTLEQDM